MNKKVKTARLSIISNSLLIILKLIVGALSGSISIISEAIHSSMDLLAAIVAFSSVKISGTPPDKKHPYGHGKFENLSGVIEAVLIFIASGWIIYEAIKKLIHPSEVDSFILGFSVMFVSAAINAIVSKKLYKVARETDSVALEADALHLKADVYTSLGVAVGLLLIWLTGYHFLDPIVAIAVALFILFEAYQLLKTAYHPLLDSTLPDKELEIIEQLIKKHVSEGMGFHQLRTRKAGHIKYIDLHLEVPARFSVKEAHDICDIIEKEIQEKIVSSEVTIHIEPCSQQQTN